MDTIGELGIMRIDYASTFLIAKLFGFITTLRN
jgi:hypothetical protein